MTGAPIQSSFVYRMLRHHFGCRSGRLAVFAPKFWAGGGDLRRPFAALWMYMGWWFYFQVVGTPHHYMYQSNFFLLQVVGTLKPCIILLCAISPRFAPVSPLVLPLFCPLFCPCFAPVSPPVLFPHLMPLMVVGTLHCSILVGTLQRRWGQDKGQDRGPGGGDLK